MIFVEISFGSRSISFIYKDFYFFICK